MNFWDKKLNPITMLPSGNTVIYPKKQSIKSKVDENIYMHFKDCREYLGIGAKKIKLEADRLGEKSIYTPAGVYYKKEIIEEIKKIISKIDETDLSGYISNTELMKMLNFCAYKACMIGRNSGLKKYNFGGRTVYYERDKAVELFSKFKK